jgi:hypothetical protein
MRGNGASDQFGGMQFHWVAAGTSGAAATSPSTGSSAGERGEYGGGGY